ncbi:GNAT family N-acetyltransferase [Ammoniphilus resinae]|uniref:Ribosomal protein S18 acetylase RimI-like enzyme n=1 Tax=Ammoniphilus resinae TaxID=861532 RepID=A0ABS4GPM1_9BACL|nr:GNAT family N-acetyltransferase [Ammoniphilus resinae]MBP1932225.1 ribosomal protein S18 acetylase RimI-like enzyme [Ammoniphilus resinae]
MITFERLIGKEIEPYVEQFAWFRLNDFKEFPYLYDGNLEHERENFQKYMDEEQSLLIVAKDGEKVIAVSTGIPFDSPFMGKESADLFLQNGLNPKDFYYFAETIILPEYRGQAIGRDLYKMKEDFAREMGYKEVCFIAVEREEDHPLRPDTYKSPKNFWGHLGYEKLDISVSFEYPTIQASGKTEMASNLMFFWKKKI